MSLPLITTWLTGAINGYTLKEDGLPANIKYSVMGLTTGIHIIKGFGQIKLPVVKPGSTLAGLFIGIPLVIGVNFCVGNYLGKAIRYAEDKNYPQDKGIKLQLL